MRQQHRTGHAIVYVSETPWTTGPTGRQNLHLDIIIDQGAASWIQDPESKELLRIAKAISAAAREAHDAEGRA